LQKNECLGCKFSEGEGHCLKEVKNGNLLMNFERFLFCGRGDVFIELSDTGIEGFVHVKTTNWKGFI
jgi:hypothetical protein